MISDRYWLLIETLKLYLGILAMYSLLYYTLKFTSNIMWIGDIHVVNL